VDIDALVSTLLSFTSAFAPLNNALFTMIFPCLQKEKAPALAGALLIELPR
jgi:hypothetical protein